MIPTPSSKESAVPDPTAAATQILANLCEKLRPGGPLPTAAQFAQVCRGITPEQACASDAIWRRDRTNGGRQQQPDDWKHHPLLEYVQAWLRQPRPVVAETRRDKRVLPRVTVGFSSERQAGIRFAGLAEEQCEASVISLLPDVPARKRVPLLDVLDVTGVPVVAKGRGAPLPLRFIVRALTCVKLGDRTHPVVRMAVTARELAHQLFPEHRFRPARHWPKLRRVLLDARNYGVHDGNGIWFPVAVRYLPDAYHLPDPVVIDIALPPGAQSGPVVDLPALDRLAMESGPRYRAYIAAHTLAWQPGTTRRRAPRGWRWSTRLTDYLILTEADRRRLAFGIGDRKHRTRAELARAWSHLPGLVTMTRQAVDPRTGAIGWVVLPSAAAEAVHASEHSERPPNRGKSSPNRGKSSPNRGKSSPNRGKSVPG